MDKQEHREKQSNFRSAFSGGGTRDGMRGSATKAGVRGVYYYDGNINNFEPAYMTGTGTPDYKYQEAFDPYVRTCKPNKRLVN